jgi:hypothetical protein
MHTAIAGFQEVMNAVAEPTMIVVHSKLNGTNSCCRELHYFTNIIIVAPFIPL